MIDIGGTIKQVRQACDHLANEYKTLAEGAIPALESLNSTIGRLTQWECRYRGQLPTTDAMLFDTKPNWFERTFGGIEPIKEVPHPRADEARQAAKELFGSIGANDAQFGLDIDDIVATPKAVSAMMEKWLTVADGFSRDVSAAIPSNPAYIPTRGSLEGWLGDTATNAYGATVSSQNSAAETTESVMRALLEQCASFLSSMTRTLGDLAYLTLQQDEYYTTIIRAAINMTKPSFDDVIDTINRGVDIANGLKQNELAATKAMGSMLTDTIHAILRLVELDSQVTSMGEGDPGWPGPAPMRVMPSPTEPKEAELRWNAEYFFDHSVFWNTVSASLSTYRSKADASTPIPIMFTRIPTFSADQSNGLNSLDARISRDALGLGATNTQKVSDLLVSTMKAYLANEAANQALADQITAEVFD